jgi:hypothetical protein
LTETKKNDLPENGVANVELLASKAQKTIVTRIAAEIILLSTHNGKKDYI